MYTEPLQIPNTATWVLLPVQVRAVIETPCGATLLSCVMWLRNAAGALLSVPPVICTQREIQEQSFCCVKSKLAGVDALLTWEVDWCSCYSKKYQIPGWLYLVVVVEAVGRFCCLIATPRVPSYGCSYVKRVSNGCYE